MADPVAGGIVARLDRPSGNVTGFANNEASMGGKWLELLSEIAPGLKRAAIMFNPDTPPVSAYMPSFETAARSLKVEPIIAPVHSDVEIETAIIALGREPGGGLVVMPDGGFTAAHRAPIILAAVATQPSAAGIKDTVWPKVGERRTLVIAFAAPLLLAALIAIPARADLDPLWSISAMTLLPVVLLSSPIVDVNRKVTGYILAFALAFPLAMVAAAPVIALVIHQHGLTNYAGHYRLVRHPQARTLKIYWSRSTNVPAGNLLPSR